MGQKEREPEVMAADFLVGERVVDPRGEDLGKIEELMLDLQAGRIRYAVVSFGGIFGLGEKLFGIPWSSLCPDPENRRFILATDREQLKRAPAFDRHSWPVMDRRWGRRIHRFYEQTPYWENLPRAGFLGGDPPVGAGKPRQE